MLRRESASPERWRKCGGMRGVAWQRWHNFGNVRQEAEMWLYEGKTIAVALMLQCDCGSHCVRVRLEANTRRENGTFYAEAQMDRANVMVSWYRLNLAWMRRRGCDDICCIHIAASMLWYGLMLQRAYGSVRGPGVGVHTTWGRENALHDQRSSWYCARRGSCSCIYPVICFLVLFASEALLQVLVLVESLQDLNSVWLHSAKCRRQRI